MRDSPPAREPRESVGQLLAGGRRWRMGGPRHGGWRVRRLPAFRLRSEIIRAAWDGNRYRGGVELKLFAVERKNFDTPAAPFDPNQHLVEQLRPPAGTSKFDMRFIDEVVHRLSRAAVEPPVEQEPAVAGNLLAVVVDE